MIETRRLKNVAIFIQTILTFVLSRKVINIYNDIARKYGNNTKFFKYCNLIGLCHNKKTMYFFNTEFTIKIARTFI